MAKNNTIAWGSIAGVIVGALLILGVLFGTGNLSTITGEETDEDGQYSYAGKNVKLTLSSSDQYTASDVDPTYYVYEEEPEDWGNARSSVKDGYVSSYSASDGEATIQETPGTYYVRAENSDYYDEFFTIEIPRSGDVSLSDYNDGGENIEKVKMIGVDSLSISNQDLGISGNETDKTYTLYVNTNVADNKGYKLDEVKLNEDDTYAFATDSDGDGIYDEGINELKVTVDGVEITPFDVSSSIDEFGGDDRATMEITNGENVKLFEENDAISMKFEITCDETSDSTDAGDEKCGNGEDFLDTVTLVDAAGNTETFTVSG